MKQEQADGKRTLVNFTPCLFRTFLLLLQWQRALFSWISILQVHLTLGA